MYTEINKTINRVSGNCCNILKLLPSAVSDSTCNDFDISVQERSFQQAVLVGGGR